MFYGIDEGTVMEKSERVQEKALKKVKRYREQHGKSVEMWINSLRKSVEKCKSKVQFKIIQSAKYFKVGG